MMICKLRVGRKFTGGSRNFSRGAIFKIFFLSNYQKFHHVELSNVHAFDPDGGGATAFQGGRLPPPTIYVDPPMGGITFVPFVTLLKLSYKRKMEKQVNFKCNSINNVVLLFL